MEKGLFKVSVLQIIYVILYVVLVALYNAFKIDISFSLLTMAFSGLMMVLSYIVLGFEKRKTMFTKDIVMNIVIDVLAYFLIIYVSGYFIGFVRSVYSNNILDILRNIFPYIFIVVFQELARYMMVSKCGRRSFGYVFTALTFIILNSLFYMKGYNLSAFVDVLDFFSKVFIPSVFVNITFSYIASKEGFLPGIIYRLVFELYVFILPIFPNYGALIESISQVVLVLVILFQSMKLLDKEPKSINKNSKVLSFFGNTILVGVAIVFSLLVSGITDYVMISIGSNSMAPVINKGDAVLYKKTAIDDIKVEDVLVFKYDGKVIVHRVVDIEEQNGEKVIYTKGDNNKHEDGWPIKENMVIGKCLIRLVYIGWPSVWIGENILS